MAYLSFISDEDLFKHIHYTLSTYSETLKSIDLKKFNANLIDPIKFTFDNLCNILPHVIKEIVNDQTSLCVEEDTVFDELQQNNTDLLKALYLLAFETYEGFSSLK